MTRTIVSAILVAALIFFAGTAPGEGVFDQTAAVYNRLSSLQADFSQRTYLARLGREKKSSGVVYYRKPRQLRWEYRQGEEGVMIGDGSRWYWYEPLEQQVVVTPYRPESGWEEALFDPSRVGNVMENRGEIDKGDSWEVTLESKDPNALTQAFILTIDKKSRLITGAEIKDLSGNRTVVRLSNLNLDPDLSGDLFVFTPPPGTAVIESP